MKKTVRIYTFIILENSYCSIFRNCPQISSTESIIQELSLVKKTTFKHATQQQTYKTGLESMFRDKVKTTL